MVCLVLSCETLAGWFVVREASWEGVLVCVEYIRDSSVALVGEVLSITFGTGTTLA